MGRLSTANGLLLEQSCYNYRLQATVLRQRTGSYLDCAVHPDADASDMIHLRYDHGGSNNNGNVQKQVLSVPQMANLTTVYAYNPLNRLSVAAEKPANAGAPACSGESDVQSGGWCQQFSYDQYGNRLISNRVNTGVGVEPGAYDSANHISSAGWQYDARGDIVRDGAGNQFGYDGEGRQVAYCAAGSGAITCDGVAAGWTVRYRYDAQGRRVRKELASGGTATYVYDVTGNLAAEYDDGLPAGDSGTQYLTADQLGSTRVVTNASGGVVSYRDYEPFGNNILVTSGSPRSGVPGYPASDAVSLQFTGRERDGETGLDYFGARYFSGAQGRFTSPDDFTKDSHVADPQSWNKYAYARNNPLRYVDPNGEEATVSTSCTTNNQNQTTCNVNISASVAIYATAGSNLTQQQMNAAAGTIQNSIQGAWTGQFQQDGVTYNVATNVNVQVVGSEAAGMQSGAQNVIGLSNGNASPTADSYVNPRSAFGAITGSGPDTGVWNINNLGNGVAAHEFTHLLGTYDKPGMVLSNTMLLNNPAIPHQATTSDYRWGVQEAVSHVNSWMHAPAYRSMRYGEVFPKPTVFNDQTTVRAARWWWK